MPDLDAGEVGGEDRGAEVVGREEEPARGAAGLLAQLGDGAASEVEEAGALFGSGGGELAVEGVEGAVGAVGGRGETGTAPEQLVGATQVAAAILGESGLGVREWTREAGDAAGVVDGEVDLVARGVDPGDVAGRTRGGRRGGQPG